MATKKANKKATTTKSAKTTVKKAATPAAKAPVVKSETTITTKAVESKNNLPKNLINIVTAEAIGTFILTMVAVLSTAYFMLPFYVGLTFVVMVLAVGAISGTHINPAVTFGLWSMRKIKTALVPFYWLAQFLGAMAAVVLLGAFSGGSFAIQFGHFAEFSWSIFALELVGTAIFMFGIAAALNRSDAGVVGKAVGIGMSLTIALLVTSSILPHIQRAAFAEYQKTQEQTTDTSTTTPTYPHEVYVSGATLNPAVALAVTESTDSQLQGSSSAADGESTYTRLSLEVILATLIGAAIGGNLFLLVNYRSKEA